MFNLNINICFSKITTEDTRTPGGTSGLVLLLKGLFKEEGEEVAFEHGPIRVGSLV